MTSPDLIEKVAIAIGRESGCKIAECVYIATDGNCECADMARAAIETVLEALREPSEELLRACFTFPEHPHVLLRDVERTLGLAADYLARTPNIQRKEG